MINEVQSKLRFSGTPLMLVTDNKSVEKLIVDNDKQSKQLISDVLLSVIISMENIDQIRILNIAGDELVRVDRNELNQCIIINEENLQNKKERYYFNETIELEDADIYISPLDLNLEYGKLELPLKPMIRIGGDEFLVILPNCLEENVSAITLKIASAFNEKGMEYTNETWEMSYGCAVLRDNESENQFIQRADHYMYEDKRSKKG